MVVVKIELRIAYTAKCWTTIYKVKVKQLLSMARVTTENGRVMIYDVETGVDLDLIYR